MMHGVVTLWFENRENPFKSWGRITPHGCNKNKVSETVYFNLKSSHYSPVRVGDEVNFALYERPPVFEAPSLAARSVDLAEDRK